MKKILLLFTTILLIFLLGCADIADTGVWESEKTEDKENEESPVSELSAVSADKIIIGFISSSAKDDCHTRLCESALRDAAEYIGVAAENFKAMYNVSSGYECERVAQLLVSLGCNVIVSADDDLADGLNNAAKVNPDVYFIASGNGGYHDNISVYSIDTTKLYYLFGATAATISDAQRIGYIASLDREKVADINAFALGALAAAPSLTLDVAFTDELDGEYAELILNQFSVGGCDLFVCHGNGDVLREYNTEPSYTVLDLCMCAADEFPLEVSYAVNKLFLEFFDMITSGDWVAVSDTLSVSDGGISVDLSSGSFEDKDIRLLSDIADEIYSEDFEVFRGEIRNNYGEIEIKDGEALTVEEIEEMDFLVQGITGTLKEQEINPSSVHTDE